MKHEPVFQGAATALVTPTTAKGVDFTALKRLVDWQIAESIDALVICGTTGEGTTLSVAEQQAVLECAVETAAGRVPVIAGAGCNDTAHAVELVKTACQIGCDAVLCVTPYYNKTTQKGLVAMYNTIADASSKPVIVYNVPSRTGVNIQPSTYAELAKHPMIAGFKEANGDISSIVETMSLVGDDLALYSGNDDQIVPLLACGGKGVISVLSNVLPRETAELCRKFFSGDLTGAMDMQTRYLPLIHALFSEVNPIPVKAAMAAMGYCEDFLRLPLVTMEASHRAVLLQCMRDVGINV